MSKAREMAEILSTPPAIYSTDAEVAATYLTQASASTIYKGSSYRNLIINGAMQVAQRGTSTASITAGGYYTADRWRATVSSMGTWTQSVETDAPTGSGFRNSLKMLCTTADASPAAGDYALLAQRFEGQNLQQVKKGTAAAEQLTVSFWVKSNVTGTYVASLYDGDNSRLTGKSYTISTSATWEKKTITFAADTTGAFDNDNADSLWMVFGLGSGSTRTSGTLDASWNTYSDANFFPGQVNLAAATNNYWQVTGVQLEVGNTATPFEQRPVGVELALCQRYYYRSTVSTAYGILGFGSANSTTIGRFFITPPVSMRVAPTSVDYPTISTLRLADASIASSITGLTLDGDQTAFLIVIGTTGSTGLTAFRPTYIQGNNSTSAYLGFSAEL